MSRDLALYVALNGSRYSKAASNYAPQGVPYLPCTIEEIINDVKECFAAGVRLVHMHSRNRSGEHRADAKWYQRVSAILKMQYPEVKFCFATSRAGEVMGQIHDKYVLLSDLLSETDARVESEMLRLACLESTVNEELPHFLTAFTATEVRMSDAAADIGHIQDAQSPEVTKRFVEKTLELSKKKKVCHELEITTLGSIDIIESLQKKLGFSTPLSIVVLPGFTKEFQFSPSILDGILQRARQVIKNAGEGFITLGRILPPCTENLESKRFECIEYALHHPCVDAIRVGIEDAPYWDREPSTNLELVMRTINYVMKLNGNIITDINSGLKRALLQKSILQSSTRG